LGEEFLNKDRVGKVRASGSKREICRNVWEYRKRHNGCERIVRDSCVCLLFGCLFMPFHTLPH